MHYPFEQTETAHAVVHVTTSDFGIGDRYAHLNVRISLPEMERDGSLGCDATGIRITAQTDSKRAVDRDFYAERTTAVPYYTDGMNAAECKRAASVLARVEAKVERMTRTYGEATTLPDYVVRRLIAMRVEQVWMPGAVRATNSNADSVGGRWIALDTGNDSPVIVRRALRTLLDDAAVKIAPATTTEA